jgi:hypothetical protein
LLACFLKIYQIETIRFPKEIPNNKIEYVAGPNKLNYTVTEKQQKQKSQKQQENNAL